jgi:tetratricopeptide (TPR) repeat protein
MLQSSAAAVVIRAAAVLAAAIALYYLCVLPYRGNLLLRVVEQRSRLAESAPPLRAIDLAHTNLRDLVRARGRRLDPEWYLLYGSNCEVLGRWEEAADTYTEALRIDDRPEIYVNRGMVMLHMAKPEAAISDLATAAQFDPGVIEQLEGELRARVTAAAAAR